MTPPQRARREGWAGFVIVVVAAVLMRVTTPSVFRTILFVAAILAATYLILRSIGDAK